MNETEKENVKEAEEEEEEEEGIWVREQRKRSRRRRRREEQLTDRRDLAPASDGGQRQRQRAEVRGQTSVIFLFFHCWRVGAASEPFGAVSKPCRRSKKKKKKRDTRWIPESGESYPYRCPTRVRHQHDAKNGVSVQPRRCLGAIRILFQ